MSVFADVDLLCAVGSVIAIGGNESHLGALSQSPQARRESVRQDLVIVIKKAKELGVDELPAREESTRKIRNRQRCNFNVLARTQHCEEHVGRIAAH